MYCSNEINVDIVTVLLIKICLTLKFWYWYGIKAYVYTVVHAVNFLNVYSVQGLIKTTDRNEKLLTVVQKTTETAEKG